MNGGAKACLVPAVLLTLLSNTSALSWRNVEIEDAIQMTRIQRTYGRSDDIVFSPDGRRFVCVVWRGNLATNENVYSLLLFDEGRPAAGPTVLLSATYVAEAFDQHATPIVGMQFLSNTVVAFLGSLNGERAQVYTVDLDTKRVRRLASHPTPIRSFSVSGDGRVVAFSALAPPDQRLAAEMRRTGFAVFDEQLPTPFSTDYGYGEVTKPTPQYYWSPREVSAFAKAAHGQWFTPVREYFVSAGLAGTTPLLEHSARPMAATLRDAQILPRPDITLSPTGTHAVIVPYTRTGREHWSPYRYFREYRYPHVLAMVTSFGLVDLRTHRAERLLDTPVDLFTVPRPLWASDGRSVILQSVLPPAHAGAYDTDPHLLEVDITSRLVRPIPGSSGWQPIRWQTDPERLIVRNGAKLGVVTRRQGEWQTIVPLVARADHGLNQRYAFATNGSVIVGVTDSLTSAPELAAHDIASKRTRVLTDLNPDLRQRQFAAVEKTFWTGPSGDTAFGYLVKPIGFVEGKRYPAVILLKDVASSDTSDDSFIIDGQNQLNGWAIQTFAARGLLVLLMPPPPSHSETTGTSREGARLVANLENAITHLDRLRLVNTRRVGVSGWSRAAYWTNYVLTHSTFPFAAATDIDGGGNYRDFQQRWGASDEERDDQGRFQLDLRRMRTPLLSEQYGETSLLGQGEYIMALRTLGKPVDLYYYPDAPHSLKRPLHRLYSLQRHLDWFQFWLQDYEDPNPQKRRQYERWHRLRALQNGPTAERR